ncbi:dihydrolipoyllysine-residue acetyltransferase [Endozoicomonas sp. G2_1]|uniref:dihydrolipoyllysine-residue acetyltransferase n=1 Tax=Endozoicomonas sp. G2_1 TaxID=2821091 RepID=UPI001ADD5205|nr:dihydrolipoyllysine-residue acetyltransferase [Endozoicomonas sp. G2_1]MBO9491943.1 dihydrolipoyllysine-residue acetyltransferase [Endozoicomonas sp. G2_1]
MTAVTDFILPDIGEGIVECELVEWLVKEGERIEEDQPVADVMTDKALVQIPAMHNGVVEKLYYQQGDIAKVHQPLFSMMVDDDGISESSNSQTQVHEEQFEQQIDEETVTISEQETSSAAPISASDASDQLVEDFILPDIGEGIVECELVEWLVAEGDVIEEDQPIADVMTDKALVQIPAMHAGKVVKLYYNKGDIAKVHSPLFAIARDAATNTTTQVVSTEKSVTSVASNITQTPSKVTSIPQKSVLPQEKMQGQKTLNRKAIASPAVRRVARELNIDIHQVPGSGKKGRIYKDDVIAFSQIGSCVEQTSSKIGASPSTVGSTELAVKAQGNTRTEAIRGVKAAMAKAMVASVSTIPHFTYCEEIDLTKLITLRQELKASYAEQGIKLTMMPFFVKAMSLALKEFPIINAQVNDDCSELTYFDDHNIGMAVDSKVGLLVPNIKSVQNLSVIDVAKEVMRLTESARSGRVASEDLKGGTISISNIGAIGGTVATPIINKPELSIVALGKVQQLPRFDQNGNVEARSIMQVSWSGDHRIIDGGTIARFNNLWKSLLENPSNMLMHMS